MGGICLAQQQRVFAEEFVVFIARQPFEYRSEGRAAVLEHPEHFADHRVGLVVSGGNVDLDHLPW